MPRDIPVGNGNLLIAFDRDYRICDLYYPHVGKENHSQGHPFRFGVWVDGKFAWVDSSWELKLNYLEDTLVTDVMARNRELGLELLCNDLVDFHENIYLKRVRVRNLSGQPREVRLFFHHDFHINGTDVGDTANYDPRLKALIHYKGDRYFLVNLCTRGGCGIEQYATGRKEFKGEEGTWRDAEDGLLSGNPIAQGSVDSTLGTGFRLHPHGEEELYYWIAAGKSHREVRLLNQLVLDKTPATLLTRTRDYWRLWINIKEVGSVPLPTKVVDLYKRSLLIIRTNIDNYGGITAANDSDILSFHRDTYSYIWPRDGALVAYALDKAGYLELSKRFFFFSRNIIREEGFFLHKYNPDGTPASSWHPWVAEGKPQLPIQEDETALVIWALWHHFKRYRNIEFIKPLYRPLIIRAGEFMLGYRDEATGLPLPSYDLWEERRGVLTFTTSTIYAGLLAAAKFATAFGENHLSANYLRACREIKEGMDKYLYRPELNRFARMIVLKDSGHEVDGTVDASLAGLFMFGPYPAQDERVMNTMRAVWERLRVKTPTGGLARYEGDTYFRSGGEKDDIPGNPWFITTLWWAEFLIAKAKTKVELEEALEFLNWVAERALPSGVLSEQVDPYTNEPLSVSPLTWSHASFVIAVHHYMERFQEIRGLGPEEKGSALYWVEVECTKKLLN